MFKIISHNSMGEMTVLIRDKRYKYIGISPFLKDRMESLLSHRNYSKAAKLLSNISNVHNR